MSAPTALRFFYTIMRPSSVFMAAALVVVLLAAYIGYHAPDQVAEVAVLVLFLQMFAASTGYRPSLRRGHLDSILMGRPSRAGVAAAHWAMSIAIGASTWLLVALVDALASRGRWPVAVSPQGLVAFFYVSTTAWMISLPFSRLNGGALWILVLLVLAIGRWLNPLLHAYQTGSPAPALVVPFLLVAESHHATASTLMLLVVSTGIAWGLGLTMVERFDAILVEPE